jgi:ankyrin repeat protein
MQALLASPLMRGVDIVNSNGDTPFMFACAGGHLGCTSLLLAAGTSLVRVNGQGLLPLQLALANPAVLDLIMRHLKSVTHEERDVVLHTRGCLGQQALHFAAAQPGVPFVCPLPFSHLMSELAVKKGTLNDSAFNMKNKYPVWNI